ncbi:TPA: EpsG family protein [Providencia rettgeri]
MNKAIVSLISNTAFIINPFIWLTFGIFELLTNSRLAYVKFAILLGLIGFTIFPWGDGYERFIVFEKSQNFDFWGFINFGLAQGDILFYAFSHILNFFNIPYQYLQFLFVTLGFMILFLPLRDLLKNINTKEKLIALIIFLSLISLISLANNMRYMLATIFSLYAIYLLEAKNKKVHFYIFFILACATHFYAIILLLSYFIITKIIKIKKRKTILVILFLSVVFAFLSPPIIHFIVTTYVSGDSLFSRKIASYLLGGDGLATKMISSPQQLLHNTILQLPLFIMVFYFSLWGDFNNKQTRYFLLFFILYLPLFYFYSLYLRLSYFCLLYGMFLIFRTWSNFRKHRFWVILIFISSILFGTIQIIYFQLIIYRDNILLVNEKTLCTVSRPFFIIADCAYTDNEIYNGNKQFRALKADSIQRTMDVISQ